MITIANLSTLHTLYPIEKSVAAFVDLCKKYPSGCLSSWPSLFSISSYGWVMLQYANHKQELIQAYKLGTIDTETFLQRLQEIFYFLPDEEESAEERNPLLETPTYPTDFPKSLLVTAWNKTIDLDDNRADRFAQLIAQANTENPTYLISNTNHLHVLKIIDLLKKRNPNIQFNDSMDLSVTANNVPVEIAPSVFLCLSYRFQLYKTLTDNQMFHAQSTMTLLNHLVKQHFSHQRMDNFTVISQFAEDLKEARLIGIPETHIFSANNFFEQNHQHSYHSTP